MVRCDVNVSLRPKGQKELGAKIEIKNMNSFSGVRKALEYEIPRQREILTKGGKHTSLPWENPKTGARGTVTPLASTYQQDGVTCRDFLASYVKNGSESWLQGEACRAERGKWEVRNLRPRSST